MKIIADRNIPFLQGVLDRLGEVDYIAGSEFNNERIKNADALVIRTVARMDRTMLDATNVKIICSATIGFDHIDTRYCDEHGISWRNAPGCNASSVVQYIVSSLLLLSGKKSFDLRGKTIGIVGVGNVGEKVAAACGILGMNVLLNDPPREQAEPYNNSFVSLDEIKKEADIITFHTPLTKEGLYKTYHLADSNFFGTLVKRPVIINSARGGIIDTEAIKDAIKSGKISGAVIDCWEGEPDIDREYLELADIATPHIAGYSADGKANAARMSLEAMANYFHLDKEPLKEIIPPIPPKTIIDLNEFTSGERFVNAVLTTYNPMNDYKRLVASPDSFSRLRNEYPLRREYPAYTIVNADEDERRILNELGFKLE